MKKYMSYTILMLLAMTALQSCDSIEDEYTYGRGQYKIDWNAAADSATATLIERFWDSSRHYFCYDADEFANAPSNNYWPQAHAMDVIVDAYLRTGESKYSDMFPQWFEGVKQMNYSNRGRNYLCEYYDDTEWIGLTIMRIYEATKEAKYLDAAKDIMAYIETGWNDLGGGGIAWATSHTGSKNACSNGPAAILAAKLYMQTNEEAYLDWATRIFTWEKENLFNQASGCVYDGLNGDTGELNTTSLSYNQGTFLGAAHLLYQITGEETYLNDARKAAYYGMSNSGNLDTGNNILRDEGTGDGGLFKGIFMRYFTQLLMDGNLSRVYANKFSTFLNNNAEVLWRKGCNKNDLLFGSNWAEATVGTTQLTSHTSGCTLVEMRALYENMQKK